MRDELVVERQQIGVDDKGKPGPPPRITYGFDPRTFADGSPVTPGYSQFDEPATVVKGDWDVRFKQFERQQRC